MSAVYERELKGILSAEPTILAAVTSALPADEAKGYEKVVAKPFLVVRAAGSLGCDLVALREDFSFPIEVKSASDETIHLSNTAQLKLQVATMGRECQRAGVIAVYAFRRKHKRGEDPWRVFSVPAHGFVGRAKLLYDRIPDLATTEKGNLVMRWRDGMPLHDLIDYVC